MNTDIFGKAISDFFDHTYTEDIIVKSPDFDDDIIPIPYLFRTYTDMPKIEQKALDLAFGNVLDVGAGAGSHSLYLQEQKKLNVTAIDISKGAIETCLKRGVTTAKTIDYFKHEGSYDTLLFLMNGSGIMGRLSNIDHFFSYTKSLLAPGGQLLIDSSDILYLFEDEETGEYWVDIANGYYGELQYQLQYKNESTDWFDWLFIDYNTLQNAANSNGFLCELITEGDANDYLAKLTLA